MRLKADELESTEAEPAPAGDCASETATERFVMSSFQEISISGSATASDDSPNPPTNKPLVAFKFSKTNLHSKSNPIQASAAPAFLAPDEESPSSAKKKTQPFEHHEEPPPPTSEPDNTSLVDYSEPTWSALPTLPHTLEVLKSGVISTTLDVSHKSHYLIGSCCSSCDIVLSHDSISPRHAVLQFKATPGEHTQVYLYDLGSEEGSFVNGSRAEAREYKELRSGDVLSFGSSGKRYVIRTPRENEEQEAELTKEELKELKDEEEAEQRKLDEREEMKEREEREREEKEREEEEVEAIDWGLDAPEDEEEDEESDEEDEEDGLEEEYGRDPQKTLREWFRWEGYDLEFHTEDRGFGRFHCWIDLTLDPTGTTERIEVEVIGDQIMAVDRCALRACRFLDYYGFLRQARKEKQSTSRNWEEVDYYESDEDNFLDRTGTIEKKRQQRRLQGAGNLVAQEDSSSSLIEKHLKIVERKKQLEQLIASQTDKTEDVKAEDVEDSNEDPLDAFMSKLNASDLNKNAMRDVKIELSNLQQEEIQVMNAINLNKAKAADVCSLDAAVEAKNDCG